MNIEISGTSTCKECIYDDETHCFRDGKDCQMQAIETVLNLLEKKDKENKELKTITNQYEAYECEAPKDSKAKIIIADKFYFNNGYFKNNFIEIDKIKRVFEDFEKLMKEGEI